MANARLRSAVVLAPLFAVAFPALINLAAQDASPRFIGRTDHVSIDVVVTNG